MSADGKEAKYNVENTETRPSNGGQSNDIKAIGNSNNSNLASASRKRKATFLEQNTSAKYFDRFNAADIKNRVEDTTNGLADVKQQTEDRLKQIKELETHKKQKIKDLRENAIEKLRKEKDEANKKWNERNYWGNKEAAADMKQLDADYTNKKQELEQDPEYLLSCSKFSDNKLMLLEKQQAVVNDECAICYSPLPATVCCIPGCGHGFCIACLLPWLKKNPTCPVCHIEVSNDWLPGYSAARQQSEQRVQNEELKDQLDELRAQIINMQKAQASGSAGASSSNSQSLSQRLTQAGNVAAPANTALPGVPTISSAVAMAAAQAVTAALNRNKTTAIKLENGVKSPASTLADEVELVNLETEDMEH